VGVAEEYLTSVLSAQSDDLVAEYFEIETLARILLIARPEKVVTLSKEVPSMVGLDAGQLGEFVLTGLALGAESIKDDGRGDDRSDAEDAGDELVVLAGDGMKEGRIESRHGGGGLGRGERRVRGFISILEDKNDSNKIIHLPCLFPLREEPKPGNRACYQSNPIESNG
jgi:hypothetical protein